MQLKQCCLELPKLALKLEIAKKKVAKARKQKRVAKVKQTVMAKQTMWPNNIY